jgi:hypothetical protein
MKSRSTLVMVTLVSAASATTGCYSTWDLTPEGVLHLDGYREGLEVKLKAAGNEEITYRHDSQLRFTAVDGSQAQLGFRSIEIEGPTFTGVESEKGAQVIVDLSRTSAVQARTFSPAKTAIAATAITVGSLPLAAMTGFFILIAAGGGGIGGGRPLRVAGRAEAVRASLLVDTHARRRPRRHHGHIANETTRARVFAHWAKEASAESASIPAFLALARDLQMASAPANLVHAALRAAREEATHTELCTDLANDHAVTPIMAAAPPTPIHTDDDNESLLRRLALEAFWDGCVAEGAAAVTARRSAPMTKDETTRLALQTIARDEHNHAELSQQIVAFCLSTGGRSVRHALMESFDRKRAAEEAGLAERESRAEESGVDDDFLGHCGVPSAAMLHEARIETWEKSTGLLARG